jgi:hypothetical protein
MFDTAKIALSLALLLLTGCGVLMTTVDECVRSRTLGDPACETIEAPDAEGTEPSRLMQDIPGAGGPGVLVIGDENLGEDEPVGDEPAPEPDDEVPPEPISLPEPPLPQLVSDDARFSLCDHEACWCDADADCGPDAVCAPDGACEYVVAFVVETDDDDVVEHNDDLDPTGDLRLRDDDFAALLFRDVDLEEGAEVQQAWLDVISTGTLWPEVMFEAADVPSPLLDEWPSQRQWTESKLDDIGVPDFIGNGWLHMVDVTAPYAAWQQAAPQARDTVVGLRNAHIDEARVFSGQRSDQSCAEGSCAPTLYVYYRVAWSE